MNENHFLRALEDGDINEAEAILETIKRKTPRTRYLYYEGMVLDAIGELEEALKKFNMALVLHLSDPSIWLAKARVLQELGKMDMARRSVDRACRLSSDNPSACLLYADILYKMKNHRGAMVQIDHAMELASEDPEILTLKGILVSILDEDYLEALKYFDRAIESDDDHASAWTNRGVALRMIGDKDGAIFSFQKALILDGDEKVAEEMLEHMGADDHIIPKNKRMKKKKGSRRTRLMIDEAPRQRTRTRKPVFDKYDDEEEEEDPIKEDPDDEYEDGIEDLDKIDDEWEALEDDEDLSMEDREKTEEIDDWEELDDLDDEFEELEEEEDPEPILAPPPPKKKKKIKKKKLHLDCPKCGRSFDIEVKGKTSFSCPSCGLSGEIE